MLDRKFNKWRETKKTTSVIEKFRSVSSHPSIDSNFANLLLPSGLIK